MITYDIYVRTHVLHDTASYHDIAEIVHSKTDTIFSNGDMAEYGFANAMEELRKYKLTKMHK